MPDAETDAIIVALDYARGARPATSSQFIAAAFLLALEAMMRQGEVLALMPDEGTLFPVSSATCDTLFRRAREATGIEGLHFHDSRREATTRLSKKLDVLTLDKAGGWREVNMLLRAYYAPSVSDAAQRQR